MQTKKRTVPAGRHIQFLSLQMMHCNISYSNTSNGHDQVFYKIPNYDTMHSSQNGIKHSEQGKYYSIKMSHIFRCDMERHIRLHNIPGKKNLKKFTQTNKAISEKSQTPD